MRGKLVVNGYQLDLSSDVAVPLNFSISDIKNPEKRKRSFSKSITLEGTSNNLKFFLSAYSLDMNISQSDVLYAPNKKYNCTYYKDNIIVFTGKFILNDVKIDGKSYQFDCTLISETIDIFNKIKDKKLNELDWSEYNHLLTRTNVINSWNVSVFKNDVSTSNFGADNRGYQPKAFGYIYPLVDYGYVKPSSISFRVTDLYPYVYVKECIQKIFDYALNGTGYFIDYTKGIFASENLYKLIYGYGGGDKLKLSASQINILSVHFEGGVEPKDLNGVQLPNTIGGDSYQFGDIVQVINEMGFTSSPTGINNGVNQQLNSIIVNSPAKYNLAFSFDITTINGSTLATYIAIKSEMKIYIDGVESYSYKFDLLANKTRNHTFNAPLTLKANQNVSIEFVLAMQTRVSTMNYSLNNIVCDLTAIKDQQVTDGSVIDISSTLPDIKCSEFISGIMNLFYLYLSEPSETGEIIIDSFKDYYQAQNVYDDWTDLVDDKKTIEIQSTNLIEGNNYIFKFNEEKDFFNSEYKKITGLNYGEKQLSVDTWKVGERVYDIPFSMYVPVKISNSLMRIPHIFEQSTDAVPVKKSYKGKGMLMYYNGLRPAVCNIYESSTDSYTIKYDYPFIHHMRFSNSYTYTPLFDLHFQSRALTFDEINQIPVDVNGVAINTFNQYHFKFIKEITSIDSKLLTLFIKLSDKDINSLDFSKLKMIDAVLYRLNSVKDFDSDAYESTMVELIKYLG